MKKKKKICYKKVFSLSFYLKKKNSAFSFKTLKKTCKIQIKFNKTANKLTSAIIHLK